MEQQQHGILNTELPAIHKEQEQQLPVLLILIRFQVYLLQQPTIGMFVPVAEVVA